MIKKNLIQLGIELMERGFVPDALMRSAMRHLCSQRLDSTKNWSEEMNTFITHAMSAPIAPVPEKANEQHYEVPAEFFELVLGKHRKYSCCYWPDGTHDLDTAEAASLDESCKRAEIEPGMRILELGCGWGSMTLWMAEHYPDTQITAVSNSNSQREHIERQAVDRGLSDQIKVVTSDMNDFETNDTFDRVVSLEMFEHMRNHHLLMRKISKWLDDDGKLWVHIFCHREQVYAFLDEGPASWMTRHFFTGGTMPSKDLLLQYNDDLSSISTWEWNGIHYKKTADAWLDRLDSNRDLIMPILRETYGRSHASRWFHRWRMFFLACSELFGYNDGTEWFVAHYLFSPAMKQSINDRAVGTLQNATG